MNAEKRRALEAAGWTFGSASDFLGLSQEDRELVEFRLSLVKRLHERRRRGRMTQVQLARAMKSSQPRVARIEANDPGVSLELLLRGLFAAGGGLGDVAVAAREARRKAATPKKAGRSSR